ncbi:MAG: response regulator [Candidatus Jordarchaeum sp.]|uniref:response regulator n=1 Tax=Candidatus Jordarchaeum sp. TaxID=2823881 RepID=UPI0040499AE2
MMLNLKMNILIVDDFATMRKIIRNILRQRGFTKIVEADDGTTALSILRKEKIDLIISDWNMPQMPGIELLKTVRTTPEWKDIPFLMVTAEGQKENVLEAVKNRVNNYVVKPFTPETLLEKINKIFEGK